MLRLVYRNFKGKHDLFVPFVTNLWLRKTKLLKNDLWQVFCSIAYI